MVLKGCGHMSCWGEDFLFLFFGSTFKDLMYAPRSIYSGSLCTAELRDSREIIFLRPDQPNLHFGLKNIWLFLFQFLVLFRKILGYYRTVQTREREREIGCNNSPKSSATTLQSLGKLLWSKTAFSYSSFFATCSVVVLFLATHTYPSVPFYLLYMIMRVFFELF